MILCRRVENGFGERNKICSHINRIQHGNVETDKIIMYMNPPENSFHDKLPNRNFRSKIVSFFFIFFFSSNMTTMTMNAMYRICNVYLLYTKKKIKLRRKKKYIIFFSVVLSMVFVARDYL